MDQQLVKELAHFKVMLKKQNGFSTDMAKLLADKVYAAEVLNQAEETDNEELVMLAIDLKSKLGLLPPAPTAAPPAEAAPTETPAPEDDPPKGKYVFGTRG